MRLRKAFAQNSMASYLKGLNSNLVSLPNPKALFVLFHVVRGSVMVCLKMRESVNQRGGKYMEFSVSILSRCQELKIQKVVIEGPLLSITE